MSQSHYETIICPNCQHPKQFVIWDLINISKDPLLLEPLLSGELTTFRCKRCRTETPLGRGLLFHDMTRRTVIWLRPPSPREPALEAAAQSLLASLRGDYTCRLVSSFAELVEKIRLTLAGQPDTAMELIKFGLASRLNLPPDARLCYTATEIAPTGRKLYVLRCDGEHGPFEIRSAESDSADLLEEHLRAVQAQTIAIGRQWVQVDRAHVAKALRLDDDVPPPKSSGVETIQVFTLGMAPEFQNPHEMDEWVAAGATTFQSARWQIGREVSPREVELHRDRKTGHLYVVYRRVGKDWKRQFVARKIFEELKAKETG